MSQIIHRLNRALEVLDLEAEVVLVHLKEEPKKNVQSSLLLQVTQLKSVVEIYFLRNR